MKRLTVWLLIFALLLTGCGKAEKKTEEAFVPGVDPKSGEWIGRGGCWKVTPAEIDFPEYCMTSFLHGGERYYITSPFFEEARILRGKREIFRTADFILNADAADEGLRLATERRDEDGAAIVAAFFLALGTNDVDLLKLAFKNLLVMVLISLAASTLFFLLSPLNLTNPTELEARTSPTIYDVLIALFGGLAGILENSRKERGTAIAGVAIATALMPPLCTAGYGLSCLNAHFFFGALYLFIINTVFITLATFVMVKYLRFKTVTGLDPALVSKRRSLISTIILIVVIPSLFSAIGMVRDNNFERNVNAFVQENKLVSRSYIYDYRIYSDHGRKVEISLTGEPMSYETQTDFFASALAHHIKSDQIVIKEHALGMTDEEMNQMIRDIYDRTEQELAKKEAQLDRIQQRLDSLSRLVESLVVDPTVPIVPAGE